MGAKTARSYLVQSPWDHTRYILFPTIVLNCNGNLLRRDGDGKIYPLRLIALITVLDDVCTRFMDSQDNTTYRLFIKFQIMEQTAEESTHGAKILRIAWHGERYMIVRGIHKNVYGPDVSCIMSRQKLPSPGPRIALRLRWA